MVGGRVFGFAGSAPCLRKFVSAPGVSFEDAHKMQYAIDAATWLPDPFENQVRLKTSQFKTRH